jgi:hypothetical protein
MSDVSPEAVTAALQARDESQDMTDAGLTRDMLIAAAPFIVAAEHERCARLTRAESFKALLAVINSIAGQMDRPLGTAAELLTAISAYAESRPPDTAAGKLARG